MAKDISQQTNIDANILTEVRRVVHINTLSGVGGAANFAIQLCKNQIEHGLKSRVLVGYGNGHPEIAEKFNIDPDPQLEGILVREGLQDFHFQGSHNLVQHPYIQDTDIIHLHNLHGNYFNPLSLTLLTQIKPIVWTLHDMHALTGHCAHSLDCLAWRTGCHQCPDLNIYPAIKKDRASDNWALKRFIYSHSILSIVVPSNWLLQKVKQSILAQLPLELIYNGVDVTRFAPMDKGQARRHFNLPEDATLIGTACDGGISENTWKGGKHFLAVAKELRAKYPSSFFVSIGKHCQKPVVNPAGILELPYSDNQEDMALYYNSLDFFLLTSIADTCPLVAIEAIACGIPVVAFDTGGIPEIARHEREGLIAPYGDEKSLFQFAAHFLNSEPVDIQKFRIAARQRAVAVFNSHLQLEHYTNIYKKAISTWERNCFNTTFSLDQIPSFLQTTQFKRARETAKQLINERISEKQKKNYMQVEEPKIKVVIFYEGDGDPWKNTALCIQKSIHSDFVVQVEQINSNLDPRLYDLLIILEASLLKTTLCNIPVEKLVVGFTDDRPTEEYFRTALKIKSLASFVATILEPRVISTNSGLFYCPPGVDTDLFIPSPKAPQDHIACWIGSSATEDSNELDFVISACNKARIMIKYLDKDDQPRGTRYTALELRDELYYKCSFFICTPEIKSRPISTLEALACGLPVVSTRFGSLEQFVQDGYNGFLVEKNLDSIILAIEKIKQIPLMALRENSRKSVDPCWSWKEKVKNYESMLRMLAGSSISRQSEYYSTNLSIR